MEIYKGNYWILISFLIIISCEKTQPMNSEIEELKNENYNLRKEAQNNQQLLDKWFDEFLIIQKELSSIDTEEILLLEYGIDRSIQFNESDKYVLINKIRMIKSLIEEKKKELSNSDFRVKSLNGMIENLHNELVMKERIIYLLNKENTKIKSENNKIKIENNQIKDENNQLDNQLVKKSDTVKKLVKELDLMDLVLNKKYIFLVSNKQAKVSEFSKNSIIINYKYRDVDILSYHSNNSYNLSKYGKNSMLRILNPSLFWKDSNNLIIRIKKGNL